MIGSRDGREDAARLPARLSTTLFARVSGISAMLYQPAHEQVKSVKNPDDDVTAKCPT
jgi:hypothetical protein